MKIVINILLSLVTVGLAQHSIPFASTGNRIELSVANTAAVEVANVAVDVKDTPPWLVFTNTKTEISKLRSNETATAQFSFSVDKSAPINKPYALKFRISSPTGEKWTKEIAIQVSPPDKFELFQNYPNPFNPSTTISYQLPVSNHITLKVYDAIGREVATLVNEVKEAGYYEVQFQRNDFSSQNTGALASGMYIYKLTADKFTEVKKMLMVK